MKNLTLTNKILATILLLSCPTATSFSLVSRPTRTNVGSIRLHASTFGTTGHDNAAAAVAAKTQTTDFHDYDTTPVAAAVATTKSSQPLHVKASAHATNPSAETADFVDFQSVQPKEASSSVSSSTQAVAPRTAAKSGHDALPGWGRNLNEAMGMTFVTHADKKHVHALAGTAWYFGGYAILLTAWAREILYNDWTTFSELSLPIAISLVGGIVTCIASSDLRHEKRFPTYSAMMRNGMVSGSLAVLLTAAFAIDPSSMDPTMLMASQAVAGSTGMILIYMSIVDRLPWDIEPLIHELDIEIPPAWAMWAGRVVAFTWMGVLGLTVSHLFTTSGGGDLHGTVDDATSRAFISQLAFSLGMAPSGDALAGTLMQKDRFANTSGRHWIMKKNAEGKFETRRVTEFFQLLLNDPGPFVITTAIALMTHHQDVVDQFLYRSA